MQEVKVFGTTHCPKCHAVMKLFEAKGIYCTFVDIEQNTKMFEEAVEKVYPNKSLPIIARGDEYMCVNNAAEALGFALDVKEDACYECNKAF